MGKYKLWNNKIKEEFKFKNIKDIKIFLNEYHSEILGGLDISYDELEYHQSCSINQILDEYNEWKIYKNERRVYIYGI
tara:strand:+ start:251 stop:484 length:234 start_codon:yes stop_codon:yes gene_type:complete